MSWQWEWVGGVGFGTLAAPYSRTMSRGWLDWVAVISGPLLVGGLLFLWSWLHHEQFHRPT